MVMRYRINGDRGDIKCEQIDGLATPERMFEITGEHIQCSDGYHTMDELYAHRIELWIAMLRNMSGAKALPWRSKLHSDGKGYDGWFVLGQGYAPGEQITYHIPMDRWGSCGFAETLERAPEWDGHTAADVLKRLEAL